MKQSIPILLLLVAVQSVAQQTGILKGRVSSKGEGLPLASVTLLKTSFGCNADSNGNFTIKAIPPGTYQLKASYVGYENFQQEVVIKADSTNPVLINMVSLTANMNEVVVTGNLKEATKLESVTPVEVYTAKFFQRNPSNNLWDAISNVNGIFPDVDNGVSNTADIQINGIEGNYTMVCIDGVPAMNGLAGVYALSALPMNMVDKIEIIRGASSTLYGSDAMAGVVNIITKNPLNAPTLSLDAYFTSMLEDNIGLTAALKLKKVSALFSLSAENMNYRWDLNNDGFTDIPLTNRVSLYNKWNFNRKDNKIATIYARYLFEDRWGGQVNTPGRDLGSSQYYSEWVRTNEWQVGFQYQLPVKEKLLLMADYSEHYQQSYYGTFYYSGEQRNIFSQLTWNKKIDAHNDLLMGATYRMKYYTDNTGLSVDSLIGTGKFLHIGGVFMEDEISFAQHHKILIGARFEYTGSNGPVALPRINYKWNSDGEKDAIRVGLGTGYRVPNVLNDGFGVMNGSRQVTVIGKLSPESNLTANGSYTRIQELPGGVLTLDANVFMTYFLNYIDPDYSQPGYVIYQNTTNGLYAPGFSINGDFAFSYPLKISLGLTYVNVWEADVDSSGAKTRDPAVHSPHFTANFCFSYNFPAPQLSIDWTGNLVSPMLLVTEPNDYRPAMSPWYSIQNIQLTKKFRKGVEFYFGVKNLFNFVQSNPIMRPFDPFNRMVNINNPNGYVFDTEYGFITTQGITGFVGVRYKFK